MRSEGVEVVIPKKQIATTKKYFLGHKIFSWSQEFFPWSQDFFLGHRNSFLGHRTSRRYLLHPFFSRQNAFLRGIANIALDRRRTAPTKDTGNEVNAAAVFSVRNNDVRTSRSKLLAATAIKAARTYTLGHTYSENHAIPESRLAQGAGEVTTRTTTEMATR